MKLYYIILFFVSTFLSAQNEVSNSDLSKKLDLILGKLGGLEERVTKLETDNVEVKKEIKEVAKSAKEAKTASQNLMIPQNEEEKESFFNKLRVKLKSQENNLREWTQKDAWDQIKKNLTSYKVRMILGNPNTIKSSLNPRIEQIYYYYGDIDADGQKEEGVVNFFRDRVVSHNSPF
jgi:vacuolar-type H+-ATPase subunit I/STV1